MEVHKYANTEGEGRSAKNVTSLEKDISANTERGGLVVKSVRALTTASTENKSPSATKDAEDPRFASMVVTSTSVLIAMDHLFVGT